ncbi:MAG: hypothetical protein H0W68_01985 [Gemmatimonadaceae bacterium]|nr:hypothetical protein [Gemmatimonadaceae bacterium]
MLAVAGLLTVSPARLTAQGRAFSIFLDCSEFYCESDFYRTEIAFVDHVRERTAADVHVLITRERTGGGGTAFTLAFYGQQRFAGVNDTLRTATQQGATEDEQRRVLSRTVQLGLARYLARTGDAARASVAVAAATTRDSVTAPTRDPWNSWVFRIGANINASRERTSKSDRIFGSVSASRVTESWKSTIGLNENYYGQEYSFDGRTTTSIRRDYGGSVLQVRSLGEHWSAGLTADAGSSTFLNQELFTTLAPALEYNVYPYKESTRHALTLLYSAGMKHFRYADTTVFFRTQETRPYQQLEINLSQRQKWGSISAELSGYHFLDDLSKSRLTFSPNAELRIVKGLSLNLFGYYAILHDQLYLSKGAATQEEVLLRQSQLATSYRAFLYMGINYTFGSVLNNVVNPRFNR